jgi:molybdate transport repressor ModE-like protein
VLTQKGGQSGGGAQVTDYGNELISYFKALQGRYHTFMEQEKGIFYKLLSD